MWWAIVSKAEDRLIRIKTDITTIQGKHAEYRQSEPSQCCDMDGKLIGKAVQVMEIQVNRKV